jgi:hypothetical protein
MKSFKYFDLNNNGTVEPDEFAKAIEKIGIMIPTKQVTFTLPFYSLHFHRERPYGGLELFLTVLASKDTN